MALVIVGPGPQRPRFIGNPGWVRSSAWIWLFSSTDSTSARSGGLRYRPTTSRSFSTNRRSRDSLKVSSRWGCRPCCFQILCTVMCDRPCAAAIVRVVQWVAARGVVCSVASTTRLTTSGETALWRPGRGASLSNPGTPRAAKRSRHNNTVGRVVRRRAAMALFGTPSLASRTTRARSATFCGVLPESARKRSRFLWLSSIGRARAGANISSSMHQSSAIVKLFMLRYTSEVGIMSLDRAARSSARVSPCHRHFQGALGLLLGRGPR